jgi:hypothetical protein
MRLRVSSKTQVLKLMVKIVDWEERPGKGQETMRAPLFRMGFNLFLNKLHAALSLLDTTLSPVVCATVRLHLGGRQKTSPDICTY